MKLLVFQNFQRLLALTLALLMVGFGWALIGCGDDDSDHEVVENSEEHNHDDHIHIDGEDEHTHADVDGMERMTANGGFMVFLSTDLPLQQGQNTLNVHLENSQGAHVTDALLEVTPWMPAHGHGSSGVPSITEQGDGNYRVENVVFQMMGTWELKVKVEANNLSDEAVFAFDIK